VARVIWEKPFRARSISTATMLCLVLALAGSASSIASRLLPVPLVGALAKPWSLAIETYLRDDGLKGLFWTYGCGG
jgi:hypothetical protein